MTVHRVMRATFGTNYMDDIARCQCTLYNVFHRCEQCCDDWREPKKQLWLYRQRAARARASEQAISPPSHGSSAMRASGPEDEQRQRHSADRCGCGTKSTDAWLAACLSIGLGARRHISSKNENNIEKRQEKTGCDFFFNFVPYFICWQWDFWHFTYCTYCVHICTML